MSISDKDRKLLWGKSNGRCNFRFNGNVCNKKLINDKSIITGKECHIVDKKPHTKRYVRDFPNRDSYENLILLCGEHHDIIDSDGDLYTVEVLKSMKETHEEFIKERISNNKEEPLIIKDSVFETNANDAEEAIGMEVNKPAQLSNVKSTLNANNVKKVVGFSTNQGIYSIVKNCSGCNKDFPVVGTGSKPNSATCPFCNHIINEIF